MMEVADLLEPGQRDIEAMLQLNNEHAKETSLLDRESLHALLDIAFFARGVDRGATALLIALTHDAPYANPNFEWFRARRSSFVYIDRIIVGHHARGQGMARRLYTNLIAAAREAGLGLVACEVNIDPPNPASDDFHAAMGFTTVGEATIHAGSKRVRYLERPVM